MLKIILATLASTFFTQLVHAETSIWRVSLGENQVYIGGTVHLLRDSDFPLPTEFYHAYENSDRIVFETDINALSTQAMQQKMMQLMIAEPEQRIDQLISSKTMNLLSDELVKRGIDVNSLMQFKASMIMTVMLMNDLNQLGMTSEGVDAYFNKRAMKDGMPIGELESLEQQLQFLSSMGEGKEEEFIHSSLQDLDDLQSIYKTLIQAWRRGNQKQLETLIINEMKGNFPDVYQQLLVQRNDSWLPKIKQMFKEPGTEYILVGVGHLIGPDGLLIRLQKEGYKITKLNGKNES